MADVFHVHWQPKGDVDYIMENLSALHRASRPQLNYSLFNDMKRFLEKIRKSGKTPLENTDALVSKHRPGPGTSISTMMTSATDPMTSVPAGSGSASTQAVQKTGINVSFQLGPSCRSSWDNYLIVVVG